MGKTLFDKIWESHVVKSIPDGPDVLYIDRHLIHEVTSPQAFSALKVRGMKVFRPEKTFADAVKGYVLFDGKVVRPKEIININVKYA